MNMKHTVTVICLIGKLLNIACADPLKEGDIDVASIDYLQAYRLVYVPAKARIADQKVEVGLKKRLRTSDHHPIPSKEQPAHGGHCGDEPDIADIVIGLQRRLFL